MSPELQHDTSANPAAGAIKALRVNFHIHPAPPHTYTKLPPMSSNSVERAQSRGREPLYSSGRGGAGNIRPASSSRDPVTRQPGPDDFSPVRGRELSDRRDEVTTTGRGGAGNLRSRSRDAAAAVEDALRLERQYTKDREAKQGEQIYSTGRGGAGNMSRSRSRSRDPSFQAAPPISLSSTGRGALANLTSDGRPSLELSKLEEEPRKDVEHKEAAQHAPSREHQHKTQEYTASGRGGVGNIHTATATAAY